MRPVGTEYLHPDDVRSDRSVAVVVLPVDVAGHRSPDGDESGSGRDRHEPALRNDLAQELVEADPCLDVGDAGG